MWKAGSFIGTVLLGILLSACGGGGGGSNPPPPNKTLSGTAATGAPVAGATVTLKDRNGVSRTTTTASNGSYSLNVTGLTPPFLVRVEGGTTVLYSTAANDGTLNVHPFTNLIVTVYYETFGTTVDAAFAGLSSTTPLPTDTEVRVIASVVKRILTPFLEALNLNPASFDLFTTPFSANGTGFDALLDQTAFADATEFTIDTNGDGNPEQQTTATANDESNEVTFNSTTTDADGNTSSSQETAQTVEPAAASDYSAAIAEVEKTLTTLANVGSTKGADAVAADFLRFIDPDFLDNGANNEAFAALVASFFNGSDGGLPTGSTVTFEALDRILSFTEAGDADRIRVYARLRVTPATGTSFPVKLRDASSDEGRGLDFRRQADGTFKFYGNQRLFRVDARVGKSREYSNNNGLTVNNKRVLEVRATQENEGGAVIQSAVARSADNRLPENCGPETFNQSGAPRALNQGMVELVQNTNTSNVQWELPCSFSGVTAYPPAGTRYEVTITPEGGGEPVTYDGLTRAFTDEPVDVITLNDMTVEEFYAQYPDGPSIAGQTVTIVVTRPDTFPVIEFGGYAYLQNQNQVCQPQPGGGCTGGGGGTDLDVALLDPDSNTVTFEIPATTTDENGVEAPVVNVGLTVSFDGDNGERTDVRLQFSP